MKKPVKTKYGFLRTIAAVIACAAVVGIIASALSSNGFTPIAKKDNYPRQFVTITQIEAKIKFDGGKVLFIDISPAEYFEQMHVPDAYNIPYTAADILSLVTFYAREIKSPKELVICSSEEYTGKLIPFAGLLSEYGYDRHIYIMTSGLQSWKNAEYPVYEKKKNKKR